MTINPFPFKVLFCFENATQLIIEIKRTDIQSEDKSLVYKWLKIEKLKQNENEERIFVLTFRSMDSLGNGQVRIFSEGRLEWKEDGAFFNNEQLAPVDAQRLETRWMKTIADFLGRN